MKAVKKTYLLPQDLINKMKRTFGTKTETEAVVRAMKEVAFQNELLKWDARNKGRLKIRNLYAG